MNLNTIRFYSKAIKAGSKYVYQTVPRLLTLWLDLGEDDPRLKIESNQKINQEVSKAIEAIPTYKVSSPPPDPRYSFSHRVVVPSFSSDRFARRPR